MIFIGNSFFGYDYSLDPTLSYLPNLTYVKLQNGVYDQLFISSDPNYDYTDLEWNFSTILWANFMSNLSAGNVEEQLSNISSVVIKRRRVGTFDWIPLAEIPINVAEDLKFEIFDRFVANQKEYEFAVIFMYDEIEGSYNINRITPEFDGIFIVSKEKIFNSVIETQTQIQQNHPSNVINTISGKYPFVIHNSENNFASGSFSGAFVRLNEENCEFDFNGAYDYREDLMNFLCDGKPKILKLQDGRTWLCVIVNEVVETQELNTPKFITSANWTEIGDDENPRHLYNSGLLDENLLKRI